MNIILLITKDDINTRKVGDHFEILTKDGIRLNFTPDALEELLTDIKLLKTDNT